VSTDVRPEGPLPSSDGALRRLVREGVPGSLLSAVPIQEVAADGDLVITSDGDGIAHLAYSAGFDVDIVPV
jgi:hypothetical protein